MSQWHQGRGQAKYYANQQASDYWSYWSGSPATWQKHKQKQQQQQQDKHAFPHYDARQVDVKPGASEDLVQVLEIRQPGASSDTTLVKDLQQLVNQARKAEQKVKRLLSDQAMRQAQWSQYERDMREAFLKEKQRHQEAVGHLEEELVRAAKAQDDARARVRAFAAQPEATTERGCPPCTQEDEDVWNAQVAAWESGSSQSDAHLGAVLQRALQVAPPVSEVPLAAPCGPVPGTAVTPPRPRLSAPRSPLLQGPGLVPAPASAAGLPSSRLQPFPPPRSAGPSLSPTAATDPYLHPAGVLTPPGQASVSQSGGRARQVRIRSSVKEGSKPQGPLHLRSTSPADRSKVLEEKRAASMAHLSGPCLTGPGLGQACIIHDDLDAAVAEIPPLPPEGDAMD